jgi:hypothetical protein
MCLRLPRPLLLLHPMGVQAALLHAALLPSH